MIRKRHLGLGAIAMWLALIPAWTRAANPELVKKAHDAMLRAGLYWAANVASHGGYVWEYSTDFSRRRGESKDLPLSTNWVQAGTPMIGTVFLECHAACGDQRLLEAALNAGRCLAYGQLDSGGWHYSIEHDPKRAKQWYHHLGEKGKGKRNTTTFDDDNTQSATRFLMELDRYVNDAEITATIRRALDCFLAAQYSTGLWDGAWPQRYPPPAKGYGAYPTFNDNTMGDCARTMLKAYRLYQKPKYLASLKRCLDFYLRAQLPAPQGTWAQQYDRNLKPAWARRFEPASATGGESRGNCMLLMDMAIEFGDQRYLDAVGRCVDWYRRSRIGGTDKKGLWARFYELKTNRPLYFTRTYKLTYDDTDLPVHYSFKSNYGVDSMMQRYDILKKRNISESKTTTPQTTPEEWAARAVKLQPRVEAMIKSLDDQGRWVKVVAKREQVRDKQGRIGYEVDENTQLSMMYSRTFATNMRTLAAFLNAANGGPAVTAPETLAGD